MKTRTLQPKGTLNAGIPTKHALAALSFLVVCSFTASEAEPFRYKSPQGVVFAVDTNGLTAIEHEGRQIASGGWEFFDAAPWFKEFKDAPRKPAYKTQKSCETLDDQTVRVRHAGRELVALFTYRFKGEDVSISTHVENNRRNRPVEVAGFRGLTVHFSSPPRGRLPVQHISYFQAHGVRLCHPGDWMKIGGTYATDGRIGVGTSPQYDGLKRTLTLWDYSGWGKNQRENVPARRLLYFAVDRVPPRGANTFDFVLRVSPNTNWENLLSPYRDHFRRTFGRVRYKADYRPTASDYLNHSQRVVSEQNPYGFHGGLRRIDLPETARKYGREIPPKIAAFGGQGMLWWGFAGDDPRGAMYRPDFDVMPPEIEANWPALARAFDSTGLKLGVCTRPRHMAVRTTWHKDTIIDINPDNAGHRTMLRRRFESMIGNGCSLFYLDSFGSSFEDVQLMMALRERLGPDVLTFCEHQCDAIFPFSGGYSETSFHPADGKGGPRYRLWSGLENWRIYEWLTPGAQLISRLYQGEEKIPPDFERPDCFFLRRHITPLLAVSSFARANELNRYQGQYLDGNAGWRLETWDED